MEPIIKVKSNPSSMFRNAARLPQRSHPKSTRNSEKSSYYQCVRTEKPSKHFLLATTHAKVANSSNSEVR